MQTGNSAGSFNQAGLSQLFYSSPTASILRDIWIMIPLELIPAYIPHGHCYLWQTGLVGLHIIADGTIALSYFSIPLALAYFARKREDLPFKEIFILFGAFIILCGITHLMNIWTLWHPDYWLSGLIKTATALVSVVTAVSLIPIVPRALNLPSPKVLEAANEALAQEICAHQIAEQLLKRQNQRLETTLQQLQQAQTLLIQTEKMASLGQLVAGISHELNNPISFIYGNLHHLRSYTNYLCQLLNSHQNCCCHEPDHSPSLTEDFDLEFIRQDLPRLLNSMQTGTNRIREILTSLRKFSRLDESGLKRVDLHECLDDTLTMLTSRLRGNRSRPLPIAKQYGILPLVECYPGDLNQVFLNVLTNAIDAIDARSLCQSQGPASSIPLPIEVTTRMLNDAWVCIQISDRGVGIAPDIQKRIFDPFFTTKPVGNGNGMGLAVSYQIVTKQHGGSLTCQPRPGGGTTFTIYLPMTAGETCQFPPEKPNTLSNDYSHNPILGPLQPSELGRF